MSSTATWGPVLSKLRCGTSKSFVILTPKVLRYWIAQRILHPWACRRRCMLADSAPAISMIKCWSEDSLPSPPSEFLLGPQEGPQYYHSMLILDPLFFESILERYLPYLNHMAGMQSLLSTDKKTQENVRDFEFCTGRFIADSHSTVEDHHELISQLQSPQHKPQEIKVQSFLLSLVRWK